MVTKRKCYLRYKQRKNIQTQRHVGTSQCYCKDEVEYLYEPKNKKKKTKRSKIKGKGKTR